MTALLAVTQNPGDWIVALLIGSAVLIGALGIWLEGKEDDR